MGISGEYLSRVRRRVRPVERHKRSFENGVALLENCDQFCPICSSLWSGEGELLRDAGGCPSAETGEGSKDLVRGFVLYLYIFSL